MDDATQNLVDRVKDYPTITRLSHKTQIELIEQLRDALEAAQRPPVSTEVDRLRAQVEAAREAWWSGTEQGDTGLVYTDRIEDAMDAIWDAIGHADWTPRERPPVSPEVLAGEVGYPMTPALHALTTGGTPSDTERNES